MVKGISVSPEIAEICAAIIGDGWIESSEKSLYIAGHLTEDRPYYDEYLVPLFKRLFVEVKPKEYAYWRVYGLGIHRTKIIKKIIDLGVKKGKKAHIVSFPDWIFFKKKFMVAALRGIFDTDGGFHCKKCYGKYDNKFRKQYHCQPRIVISSTSKKLIFQIYEIMNKLGFNPERIKSREAEFARGRNNRKNYFIKLNRLDEIER